MLGLNDAEAQLHAMKALSLVNATPEKILAIVDRALDKDTKVAEESMLAVYCLAKNGESAKSLQPILFKALSKVNPQLIVNCTMAFVANDEPASDIMPALLKIAEMPLPSDAPPKDTRGLWEWQKQIAPFTNAIEVTKRLARRGTKAELLEPFFKSLRRGPNEEIQYLVSDAESYLLPPEDQDIAAATHALSMLINRTPS